MLSAECSKHLLSKNSEKLQRVQPSVGVWCLQHSSLCSVALTPLMLETITSILESSRLQTPEGTLPTHTAAPAAPGRSGTVAPWGS